MHSLELDAKKAVSENLVRVRKEKGLTQKQLQEKTGITQATLSRIEAGLVWPDYQTLVLICNALEVEHTEIMSHPDLLDAFKKIDRVKTEQK